MARIIQIRAYKYRMLPPEWSIIWQSVWYMIHNYFDLVVYDASASQRKTFSNMSHEHLVIMSTGSLNTPPTIQTV